ncbi:hypothetical protein, partial [Staphylococcus epidermidis]|uniref:hypothetical protein n=2 Tax=Staphylococcus epidermidis TaxID=1282 RepID=UPI002284C8D7
AACASWCAKAKVAIPAVAIVAVAIFFIVKYPPKNLNNKFHIMNSHMTKIFTLLSLVSFFFNDKHYFIRKMYVCVRCYHFVMFT